MNETFEYLKSFAEFPFALRRFLRERLTVEQARRIVQHRMERREENFLALAERSVYGHPQSPYLALLKLAGCEFGDLRESVKRKGLEGTLHALRGAGVYVTFEEFKGRREIVRAGRHVPAGPRAFDNPFARRHFSVQTGGSTGLSAAVNQNMENVAAGAAHDVLMLDAWGALNMPPVHWMHTLPGSGLKFILRRSNYSRQPETWFAPVGWRDSKYWMKYSGATLYMIFWMRALGIKVGVPKIVPMENAAVVARGVRDVLDRGEGCLFYGSVSRGVRVCVAAEEAGFDLKGAIFRVGGEPVTEAKAATMRRSGVRVLTGYGGVDTGRIGLACTNPAADDDVHFCKDSMAMIVHPHYVEAADATVPALNLTSLLDTIPKIMLNYQLDDYATYEERRCGCPLEAYGYTGHLHGIRSYSKSVGEAVSLVGNELINILEKHLPARYGGSPLDYQMMEEEDSNGFTRLYLVVHPRIEVPSETELIEFVLKVLADSSPMGDGVKCVWRGAQTLRVRRMEPVWTARGKLLPLQLQRRAPKV